MNDTPITDARWETLCCNGQSWYLIAEQMMLDCRQLERELTAVTEQREEARQLAQYYRNLSCETQDEADETLLPWE